MKQSMSEIAGGRSSGTTIEGQDGVIADTSADGLAEAGLEKERDDEVGSGGPLELAPSLQIPSIVDFALLLYIIIGLWRSSSRQMQM